MTLSVLLSKDGRGKIGGSFGKVMVVGRVSGSERGLSYKRRNSRKVLFASSGEIVDNTLTRAFLHELIRNFWQKQDVGIVLSPLSTHAELLNDDFC